ncbi:MAG: fluoride efflux transporter CrcB [Aliihoeflea sp.]
MVDTMALALVAAGGAAGGVARFTVTSLVARRLSPDFPWGTLLVNLTGAFLIGLVAGHFSPSPDLRIWQLAVIGFLGSYTTVSSFSLQTLSLVHAGRPGRAAANVVLSILFAVAAAAFGFRLAS